MSGNSSKCNNKTWYKYLTSRSIMEMWQLYNMVLHNASGEESWLCEIKTQWTMWYTEDMDGQLVQKGVNDLKHLAVRLSKLFPLLVTEEKFRGGLIKFITSSKHRCVNSTLSFKAGLTELWDIKDQELDHEVNDSLMRFFDKCTRFVQEVHNNPSAVVEVDKFKQGPEMKRVMEYASDLREFWKRGYGHDIISKSSCILFHDVFNRLNKAASEIKSGQQVTEAVTVQIGHADTILPLLVLLGFFKDSEALTSTNYATQTLRSLRTSHMMPYAANLLLVLYDCGGGDLRLQPLLSEKPVTFPGLAGQQQASMPLYEEVKEHYRELLQGYDFETETGLAAQSHVDDVTGFWGVRRVHVHPAIHHKLFGSIMPIVLWKLVVVHLVAVIDISCCFHHDVENPAIPAIAKYFSTKGRYEEVNPHLVEDILAVNRSVLQPPSPQCRKIHLTAIIRHGTRYPTTKNIKKMKKLYNLVKSSARGEKSWLREIKTQWTMWYTEDMDGRLVQKGVNDHKHLAVRLSKLFPSLVSEEKLRGGLIKFITSSKHRCVNSTLSFKAGLTELWDIKDQEFDHAVNDALMRFFDKCTKFVKEVGDNPTALTELDKFTQGPEMRRVQEKIADRLQVLYSNITDDMAEAAFYLCAYEFAIKTVNSPWCRLFDEVDALVMEYANDLKQYWKRSYGYDINSKSSCILFHDLFSRLNKAAEENKSGQQVTEAVTIQIGHAETLLPLLTLLGFFKDSEALTSTNYATQTDRSFRTSRMLPYAANLLLVLYDCGGGDLRLQPLLNEKPVTFPGLADQQQASMPLYEEVKEHYRELLQGCDFETECQLFKQPAEV
ncbi:hypothetical protein INR49_018966 [Caranx melampygus]|nr:hypothetical protein INR49_018966 [Caranx melampygus]